MSLYESILPVSKGQYGSHPLPFTLHEIFHCTYIMFAAIHEWTMWYISTEYCRELKFQPTIKELVHQNKTGYWHRNMKPIVEKLYTLFTIQSAKIARRRKETRKHGISADFLIVESFFVVFFENIPRLVNSTLRLFHSSLLKRQQEKISTARTIRNSASYRKFYDRKILTRDRINVFKRAKVVVLGVRILLFSLTKQRVSFSSRLRERSLVRVKSNPVPVKGAGSREKFLENYGDVRNLEKGGTIEIDVRTSLLFLTKHCPSSGFCQSALLFHAGSMARGKHSAKIFGEIQTSREE